MGSFKRVFDPLDLEIIDRVYEVAWAHVQAHQPNRDTASDGKRQEALRKKIFGVARIMGSGHIDFEPLTEVVLAIPGLSMPNVERLSEAGDRHVLQREGNVECSSRVQAALVASQLIKPLTVPRATEVRRRPLCAGHSKSREEKTVNPEVFWTLVFSIDTR